MRTIGAFTFILALASAACERQPSSKAPEPSASRGLTVFAAASTTDVMTEAGKRYQASTGIRVVFSFDSSSSLARQIKAGAPADLFISADELWMDDVVSAGVVRSDTREDLLGNELVLIAPIGKGFEAGMSRGFDFAASLPQIRRIAVGDPSHVPVGRYAKQALESLNWWSALQPHLVPALDVRATLRLVETGEADAGIVYATDARRSDRVLVVGKFPPETHDPIRYPVAICTGASAEAVNLLRFLRSSEMKKVFEEAGFRAYGDPTP